MQINYLQPFVNSSYHWNRRRPKTVKRNQFDNGGAGDRFADAGDAEESGW
jgi:hypothetical protein